MVRWGCAAAAFVVVKLLCDAIKTSRHGVLMARAVLFLSTVVCTTVYCQSRGRNSVAYEKSNEVTIAEQVGCDDSAEKKTQ